VLSNLVVTHDKELGRPFDILSLGLLRCGRRKTRLAVELGTAAQSFSMQLNLCRYERLAFLDRRLALGRRRKTRLAVELGTAAQSFSIQPKLCRYERLAYLDRRLALGRRREVRKESEKDPKGF